MNRTYLINDFGSENSRFEPSQGRRAMAYSPKTSMPRESDAGTGQRLNLQPKRIYEIGSKKGQALVIVVVMLSMLSVIGIAFFVMASAERVAAIRHLDSLRAQYITEAGILYAQKVLSLDRQLNLIDSKDDLQFIHFEGQDADLDGDNKNESRWFTVSDYQGNSFGRFGIHISDEASRLHLNTASEDELSRIFSKRELPNSGVSAVISKRPLNAKEELSSMVAAEDFNKLKDWVTIYSRDFEIDLDRRRRAYLNSSQFQIILEAFFNSGINNPWQKAANLKDAIDTDLSQTVVYKFSQILSLFSLAEAGDWYKDGSSYAAPEGGRAGKFVWSNLSVEDGDYFCFVYGASSSDTVGEIDGGELLSGDCLKSKVKVEGGNLSLVITPAKNKTSRFSHIEFAGLKPKLGLDSKMVVGTEAVVINELMVKPSKEILVDNPSNIEPGQSQKWIISGIKAGSYYLIVEAINPGQMVGNVYINGRVGSSLRDQDYFPEVVDINGDLTVDIKNESLEAGSFKGIKILQEPDGEFIELLNLSSSDIDLSGFSVEVYTTNGEFVAGWPAKIPDSTTIRPYQYLVVAMDSNDSGNTPINIQSNNISFQNIYSFSSCGPIFSEASQTINRNSDLLPNEGGRIVLKDGYNQTVDAVEYLVSQVVDFKSLERADPSFNFDSNGNGLFDGWYLSNGNEGTTATFVNDNSGMYTNDGEGGEWVKHSPSEVKVFNHPLSNLKDVLDISSGENWKKFALLDIAQMADHFAVSALDIDLAGHYKEGEFRDNNGIFESSQESDRGLWEFNDIPKGKYLLSIISSDKDFSGERIKVAIKIGDNKQDFYPLLFAGGFAVYGTVDFVSDSLNFQLEIINDSSKKISLKGIRLEPVSSVSGRINVNTAKEEVLSSVLISDNLVNLILSNRPIGLKDNRNLGIGELFLLDPDFVSFHNYLTVKSDVYEIISRGELIPAAKTIAYQVIRSVVERGD